MKEENTPEENPLEQVVDASAFWEAIEHLSPPYELKIENAYCIYRKYWMSGGFPEAKTHSNLPKTAEQEEIEERIEREQLLSYIKKNGSKLEHGVGWNGKS